MNEFGWAERELSPFGLEIRGIRLDRVLSPAKQARIAALFRRHKLLVMPDQTLGDDDPPIAAWGWGEALSLMAGGQAPAC